MGTRRAQRDPDRPDRLHDPVAALGSGGRLAAERGAYRGLGVDGVGLAAAATRLTVRPVHLDHLDARADQMARQPRPIGAGALHADPHQRPERPQPPRQLAIPDRVRPERRRGEHPARLVDRRSDMDLLVRVDAPVDADWLISHDEPCLSPNWVSEAPSAGTADRTVKVFSKAPMRSRPPDRSVRASSRDTRPTDHEQGTKPVTPRVTPRPDR